MSIQYTQKLCVNVDNEGIDIRYMGIILIQIFTEVDWMDTL